jgi:hypothetical protein
MSRPLLNSAGRLVMLCGFQVVLKFLLGRMHGLMRSQRRFELAAACAPVVAPPQQAGKMP